MGLVLALLLLEGESIAGGREREREGGVCVRVDLSDMGRLSLAFDDYSQSATERQGWAGLEPGPKILQYPIPSYHTPDSARMPIFLIFSTNLPPSSVYYQR